MSENNNISVWKQAGIYGVEFGAAGIGTSIGSTFAILNAYMSERYPYQSRECAIVFIKYCTIGNILLGSSCVWVTGKLLKQECSFFKSCVGIGLGSILGNRG
ncbi:MAG: hypothetical protein QMD71_01590 [bacterium]|nr:hypothetical protein [bacterium]